MEGRTACRLLCLLIATTQTLAARYSGHSSSTTYKMSKELTPEERENSCAITGKFDDSLSTCNETWWTLVESEERVGEGSTCRTKLGRRIQDLQEQLVPMCTGLLRLKTQTTTLGRHQETASQGGLTLWNILMRGIWAGIGLMVTNVISTSTSQCSVIPYRRFPTVNGAALVTAISPVTSVLIHVTKDIAWSGQALCIVSSLGRAWSGAVRLRLAKVHASTVTNSQLEI
ncbi:hypothetical protein BaRGS_00038815 [Batillaria attramentaria]|uniref:Uncharacterized protein n=1 Tax=Batillaria attramentaria TaxID=370345 RepID=A0ABD0J4T5_9CAEN